MTLEELVAQMEDLARRQSFVTLLGLLPADVPPHDLADARDVAPRARAIVEAMTPGEREGAELDRPELERIAREARCDVADVECLVRASRKA